LNETLDYLRIFAGYPFALRSFLASRLTLAGARRLVAERMQHREENFLALAERSIYGWPDSPYLALLRQAGCDLGDLRGLVAREGLEGALRSLREAGVYVTFEEFKGRKPIVRGALTLPASARQFDNPAAPRHFTSHTGGSTGLANAVSQNLDHIAARSAPHLLMLAAHNVAGAPSAVWIPILPGGGMSFVLRQIYCGQRVERWFSAIGWRDSSRWPRYSLATLYMLWWLRLFGAGAPMPRIVRHTQALEVARWMHDAIRREGACLLFAGVSLAVRVALAARAAGLDLTGATIRGGGEPLTDAKRAAIMSAGARCLAGYGSGETGSIGLGCLNPAGVDDVHLAADSFALFSRPYEVPGLGLTVPAFNLTTLHAAAPKVLVNYQSDDYGLVSERDCGCELSRYGYTTHLEQIRSYGKLVGEAVTLIGNDLQRILEEVLPQRFGGSPLDYQFLEQEDPIGFTRVYLVVHPRLAIPDEQSVLDTLHAALRETSPMADAARAVWQPIGTLQLKRIEPVPTARGKLLPLHIERHAAAGGRTEKG
jgi:hypothetical protein